MVYLFYIAIVHTQCCRAAAMSLLLSSRSHTQTHTQHTPVFSLHSHSRSCLTLCFSSSLCAQIYYSIKSDRQIYNTQSSFCVRCLRMSNVFYSNAFVFSISTTYILTVIVVNEDYTISFGIIKSPGDKCIYIYPTQIYFCLQVLSTKNLRVKNLFSFSF